MLDVSIRELTAGVCKRAPQAFVPSLPIIILVVRTQESCVYVQVLEAYFFSLRLEVPFYLTGCNGWKHIPGGCARRQTS